MKIRSVCLGISFSVEDFDLDLIEGKIFLAKSLLSRFEQCLIRNEFEVQTLRISLNSFETWNPMLKMEYFQKLADALKKAEVHLCTIGACSSVASAEALPGILGAFPVFSSSIIFKKKCEQDIAPDYELCLAGANTCLNVAKVSGDLGNFRFCASFNCPAGIPFFPASYQEDDLSKPSLTIGLENADVLFLAFYGTDTMQEGRANLVSILEQSLAPIQAALTQECAAADVTYLGIDASINPGLSLPDSVGAGLEALLNATMGRKSVDTLIKKEFGCFGTLAAVSAVTGAIREIREKKVISLVGYSGLMIPVMEDLIIAERAAGSPISSSPVRLRDLLVFSSVCGVGLDTVPVPGCSSAEEIAAVYMETGAMAFRLNKPLSCRLLPMIGKGEGDMTDVVHASLCNTRVFGIV